MWQDGGAVSAHVDITRVSTSAVCSLVRRLAPRANADRAIDALLARQEGTPTWQGLVLALDELGERLGRAWSPVSHLNAVCNSAELRSAYEACLPKLSEYWTELGQNRELFQAYEALASSPRRATAHHGVLRRTEAH